MDQKTPSKKEQTMAEHLSKANGTMHPHATVGRALKTTVTQSPAVKVLSKHIEGMFLCMTLFIYYFIVIGLIVDLVAENGQQTSSVVEAKAFRQWCEEQIKRFSGKGGILYFTF